MSDGGENTSRPVSQFDQRPVNRVNSGTESDRKLEMQENTEFFDAISEASYYREIGMLGRAELKFHEAVGLGLDAGGELVMLAFNPLIDMHIENDEAQKAINVAENGISLAEDKGNETVVRRLKVLLENKDGNAKIQLALESHNAGSNGDGQAVEPQ